MGNVNMGGGDRVRPRNAGLTLLEVMIVLAIIALVVGLAAPRLMSSFGRAKSQAAQIQLTNIRSALQLYYIDVGRYPSEAEGLGALLTAPSGAGNWQGPYIEDEGGIVDPWTRRYIYRFPGTGKAFDLLSYGRDGKAGGSSEDSDISL
jgi:general secretion pathway protein G